MDYTFILIPASRAFWNSISTRPKSLGNWSCTISKLYFYEYVLEWQQDKLFLMSVLAISLFKFHKQITSIQWVSWLNGGACEI